MPFEQIMPAVAAGDVDAGLVIHESRFHYPSLRLEAVGDLVEGGAHGTRMPIPPGALISPQGVGQPAHRATTPASCAET